MKQIILLLVIVMIALKAQAQNQGNIWMFGYAGQVNFNSSTPTVTGIPGTGGTPPIWNFQHSGAVCNNNGQLQFFVKLHSAIGNPNAANYPNVFTVNGLPMPNGNLLSQAPGNGIPLFTPVPGEVGNYYIFYVKNGGLYYSKVDMSLNGGAGDIVISQKNVQLSSHNKFVDQKLTSVKGCNGIWIVARTKNENKYYAYKITNDGIDSPVISETGNLPPAYYGGTASLGGVIKSSNNGDFLAAACNTGNPGTAMTLRGGLELYKFEKCSGQLSNTIVLDTIPYFGICFSPDNSKLYATAIFERALYQFDLSLTTPAAIIASKTFLMSNPTNGSPMPDEYLLGDLKLAPNGKIYFGNNNCEGPYSSYLHCISNPNLPGIACVPLINNIQLGSQSICTGLFLPADIISSPIQDTLIGTSTIISACFNDSVITAPFGNGSCHYWADTVLGQIRQVRKPGTYIVYYNDDNCKMYIDTFHVRFPKLPTQGPQAYACPRSKQGKYWLRANDSTNYRYLWSDQNGNTLRDVSSSTGDAINGLDTGSYFVRITTAEGCDTTLKFLVKALPEPVAAFATPDIVCENDTVTVTNLSSAPLIRWYFEYDSSTLKNPFTIFYEPGLHSITQVVTNIEGCRDTAVNSVTVRDFRILLSSDKEQVNKNEIITLRTEASESYSVYRWLPDEKFSDSSLKVQQTQMDTSRRFTVFAASQYGCKDSASIFIHVKPIVFLPTAFSPNGDGLNDRFRPISVGSSVFIRFFYVYNRWGQMVWGGQGPAARQGWDGMHKGIPAELGTYYYIIEMEDFDGNTIAQKGDVTLIR